MFYQQFPFLCVMQELGVWLGGLSWKGRAGDSGNGMGGCWPQTCSATFTELPFRKATAFDVFPSIIRIPACYRL